MGLASSCKTTFDPRTMGDTLLPPLRVGKTISNYPSEKDSRWKPSLHRPSETLKTTSSRLSLLVVSIVLCLRHVLVLSLTVRVEIRATGRCVPGRRGLAIMLRGKLS